MQKVLILRLKARMIRLDNKRFSICCLKETHFKCKEADRLQRQRRGKHSTQTLKKNRINKAILMADKIDSKKKK